MAGWQDHPFGISVKKGETVAFCMCNNSKNGPYCDGSHKSLK
ncbi:MAG: CDGSH iron-sulfur domain-containing protein [Nitrosarchaeum sp.]|nr:CDGSH iron-sulfur domain-containing protein [Nitrosarchaeum sp.]